MRHLTANEALDPRVVRAPAESRLADILELVRARQAAYCAVFDQGRFRGLVKVRDIIFLSTQRIFADLLPGQQPCGVSEETSLEEITQKMEEGGVDALPVFNSQNSFVGIVTHESLIEVLLRHKQMLLGEAQRMKAVIEADRKGLAERTERLEQLHLASKDLLSLLACSPVEGALLQKGIEALARLLQARYGAVAIVDEQGKLVQFAHTGLTAEEVERIGEWPQGHGLLGAIIQEHQALRLDDVTKDPRHWGFPPHHPKMTTLLGVPIASRGRCYGRVYLTEKVDKRGFTVEDEALAATFANSLALAIENTRLFEETVEQRDSLKEKTRQLEALNEAARLISGELALDELLKKLAAAARQLVGARYGALGVYDELGKLEVFVPAGMSEEEIQVIEEQPGGKGLLGTIQASGKPIRLDDLTADRRSVGFPPHHPPMGSFLGVPIISRDRVLGSFYMTEKQGGKFTEDDERLLVSFAASAAVAIENAHLYTEERAARRRAVALGDIIQAASSTLDLKTLLMTLVRKLVEALGVERCTIYLPDVHLRTIADFVTYGVPENQLPLLNRLKGRKLAEFPIARRLLEATEPILIPDASQSDLLPGEVAQALGMKATMCAPVRFGNHPIAALFLDDSDRRSFASEDVELVQSVANQAAVAIEKARLYQDTGRRLREVEGLYEITQRFSAMRDPQSVYGQLAELIAKLIGAARCIVATYDHRTREIRARSPGYNVSQEMVAAARYLAGGELKSQWDLHRRGPFIAHGLGEIPDELRWFAQQFAVENLLAVAMVVEARVVGVIYLANKPDGFTPEDARLVTIFAGQAARVIENARLYEQLAASEAKYRQIFQGAIEGIYQSTPDGKLLTANPAMARILGYEHVDELLGENTFEFYVTPEDREQWQQQLDREGAVFDVEMQHRRRDGRLIWVRDSARAVRDADGQVLYYEGAMLDITERKRAEAALRSIIEGTASVTGSDFFRSLVCHLASALEVRYAIVAECTDATLTRVRMLAFWLGEDFGDDFEYELAGTPCENVAAGTMCYYPEGVQDLFPQDEHLVQLRAESYLGMPLFDSSGQAMGLLAVLDDKPMGNEPHGMPILKIFAARAGAELERQRREALLGQYAERLSIQHKIDQAVLAAQSPRAIAEVALKHIQQLVPYERASVTTFDLERDRATVLAATGSGKSRVAAGTCVPLGMFGVTEQLRQGTVRLVEDLRTLPRLSHMDRVLSREGVRSYLNAPLIALGELIGNLNLGWAQPLALSPAHMEIAREVADSLAVAIQHARLFEQVQVGEQQLGALSRRLIEAQESERRRIARELHDEIGQVLTAVKISLQAVERLPDASPLAPRLQESTRTVERALQQVRNLSFDLRPSLLDDLGLVAALRWFVDQQAQQSGFTAQFRADTFETPLSPELETACFRITQEALTNVTRHARAEQVQVELRQRGTELELFIRDDGVGFATQSTLDRADDRVSLGLLGMRERALLAGGHVEVESGPRGGTTVRARFPLKKTGVKRETGSMKREAG